MATTVAASRRYQLAHPPLTFGTWTFPRRPGAQQCEDQHEHDQCPHGTADHHDPDDEVLELNGRDPLSVQRRLSAVASCNQDGRQEQENGSARFQGDGPCVAFGAAGPSSNRIAAGARFSAGRVCLSSLRLGAVVFASYAPIVWT